MSDTRLTVAAVRERRVGAVPLRAGLILKLAWRDWRSGELGVLLAAVLVAVGTVTAISTFVDRLERALVAESANFLAADRVISGSRPVPDEVLEAIDEAGVTRTRTMTFPSMLYVGDENQLVSVKAVAEGYPLRGVLLVADEPFADGRPAAGVPAPGTVWLDSRLLPSMGVALGDRVEIGVGRFRVDRVLIREPDRGGGIFDFGPRALMRVEDVPATEVVQPGSRIGYRTLLRGTPAELEALHERLAPTLEPNFRWRDIRDTSPSIGRALDRAESYLLLGALLAVLLAGVAVALAAHRYARRHFDHVAIFKTLGATPRMVALCHGGTLAIIGSVAVVLGLALGLLVQTGIVAALSAYMPLELPPPGLEPALVGVVTGLVCLFAFAWPPIARLKDISPMRVIRRDLTAGDLAGTVSYGAALLGALGLLIWYSGSIYLTLWTLAGTAGAVLVFGALALVLLRGGRALGMQAGSVWRLALAALTRRRRENVAQMLIFGLAIMLLLILVLLRTALIDEWQAQVPENAPNHFALNIDPTQVDAFRGLVEQHATLRGGMFPMMRGRVVAVNGIPAEAWEDTHRDPAGDEPRLTSERNLTFASDLPSSNTLLQGEWWGESTDESLVSLEEEYAQEAGLEVGDELAFDVGGFAVNARIASIRRVEWDSLQPNFFVIFSPPALEGLPSTYMTSFFLPPSDKRFLNTLLERFPTVTVIEVDELIAQVQRIIGQVSQAVELVLSLVVAAGCLVLLASVQASRDERMKEHALLRTLGGTRRLIGGALTVEFLMLGLFSGVLAVVGAEATVIALSIEVFELPARMHPWLWLLGPVIGAALITTVGLAGTLRLIRTPPALVLRELS